MSEEEDEVDPRIQIELEKLNNATDVINHLEVELDDARCTFRNLLAESTARINALSKKLGSCIEKSRPYYEARIKAHDDLQKAQKAAIRFERANSSHEASKEMVQLAEEGLMLEGRTFDHAWQEMLNHATMRVNDAEKERSKSEEEHRFTSLQYQMTEKRVQQLQSELKKSIAKSSRNARRSMLQLSNIAYQHHLLLLPYFEMKAHYNKIMEDQKQKIRQLEDEISRAKFSYANALEILEKISDEIHQSRGEHESMKLGTRGAGVGADSPELDVDTAECASGSNIQTHPLQNDEYLELPQKFNNAMNFPCQKCPPPVLESEYYQVPLKSPSINSLPTETNSLPATNNSKTATSNSIKIGNNSITSASNSHAATSNSHAATSNSQAAASNSVAGAGNSPAVANNSAATASNSAATASNSIPTASNSIPAASNSLSGACSSTSESSELIGRSPPSPTKTVVPQSLDLPQQYNNISTLTPCQLQDTPLANPTIHVTQEKQKQNGSGDIVKKCAEPAFYPMKYRLELLDRAGAYLDPSPEDFESSDCDSLTSVEMLSDDQILSLSLQKSLDAATEEILATPLAEEAPLIAEKQTE